ncbi:hypothetical protein [Streptomyces sp. NPDC088725]|uniref:hypothetical protein n=1 Tax=Streptomyces sp. NPDC088725 TaxID=3365873 RepID=UPI003827DEF9
MNRRALPVTTALATGAALLLTACGGGGDASSSDKVKGVDQTSSSPSASRSAAPSDGRPEISLPATFQMEFQGWTSTDPEKQAVMNDGKERLRAVHAAIIADQPTTAPMEFYSSGNALTTGRAYVKDYMDDNVTLIGKAIISDPKVDFLSKQRATLFYCMDEGQGSTKDRKTGAVKGTPKGVNPHVLYMTGVTKNPEGVWKTATVETKRGGC